MSIRCSGFASRSFIIGSRLCPPAMTRASGASRASDAIAPSTLLARSYSNGAGTGIEAVDETDGVLDTGLLHEHALEQLDARVEVMVDRRHDPVDRLRLLDDLAHAGDHLVEPVGDRPQRQDRRDEVVDERED